MHTMRRPLRILILTVVVAAFAADAARTQPADDPSPLRNLHRDFGALVKSMQSLQEEFAKSDRKQDKPRAAALKSALQRIRASR